MFFKMSEFLTSFFQIAKAPMISSSGFIPFRYSVFFSLTNATRAMSSQGAAGLRNAVLYAAL